MIRTKPPAHGSSRSETFGSRTGASVGPAGFPAVAQLLRREHGRLGPKVTNGFAAERDVILVDNAGVGGSSGETPSTVAAMTKACADFCRALDLKSFDVVGFSLGGMIAQQLASSPSSRSTSWPIQWPC